MGMIIVIVLAAVLWCGVGLLVLDFHRMKEPDGNWSVANQLGTIAFWPFAIYVMKYYLRKYRGQK